MNMLPAVLGILAIVAIVLVALRKAEHGKKDIKRFGIFAIATILLFTLANGVFADRLEVYAGGAFAVDWPHEQTFDSPQCVDGQWTSDGRLYVGAQWEYIYLEFTPWLHKSCALQDDRNVYDAYQITLGVEYRLTLFK